MNLDQSIQEVLDKHGQLSFAKQDKAAGGADLLTDLTRLFEEHSKERVRKTVRDIRQSGMGGFDSWEERFWAVIEKIDEVEDRFVAQELAKEDPSE